MIMPLRNSMIDEIGGN